MTRKLDLRSGRPVWTAYRPLPVAVARLTRDVTCDVLVVGLGISGAMVADALSAAGHAVVGIDRRGPFKGSTAATTALVQYEIDQPITRLSGQIGADRAARAWLRARLAVSNLKARADELGVDLALRRSLYLAGTELSGARLRAEAEARRAAGLYARYVTPAELRSEYGLDRAGAIASHDNLALDPRKLTSALLRSALDRKARLYAPVEATDIAHHAGGVEVTTKNGPVIAAGHVVLATGYELFAIVPAPHHRVLSTWAIATRPQKRGLWPHEAFIWEASDPYLYVRAMPDGRVICGGEDEDFSDEAKRDAAIAAKTATLARKLGRLLPNLDTTPEFAWAGAFGSMRTGLPIIGPLPGRPRISAILGYGGNGITFSRIASEIVAATLAGNDDRDADLFSFAARARTP